jgi:uroporphyrinogen decarboxylase
MPTLNCGERIVRCLLGQSVDRVPFGVGLGWYPWGETLDRWRRESQNPELSLQQELDFDLSFAIPSLEAGIFPQFERQILEETAEFIVQRDGRGIVMRNRRDGGSMPEFLDYPVKTPADWAKLKNERLQFAPQRVNQDWPAFRQRLAQTGEAVQVGWFPYGVFGTVRDLMGVEQMLVGFYDEPAMLRDMMEHLTGLWLSLWQCVAAEVQIDHIHIWEDMAGRQGSLISPAMVESFMMPCYDRIAEFAKKAGIRIISVDTDGDCAQLVPVMARHGVNAFFPFEVQAGNDIFDYRSRYPELGILGGLDKRALAEGRQAIDREVNRSAAMVERGRYIPGFDHLIPPDVPWENYRYAAVKIREICYRCTPALATYVGE